ncbi:hypothetical protein G9U52_38175 [Paenibacillus sp. S3N08]|uniref:NADP-dependent oxidoreductase domain-containing protein n=1 Tax=Paenibacillus agricola TaxID=2716264 RepID=A0ABX0JKS2_9BACL|nr:hypothetical protein [Paenibacillus agricola]
MKGIALEIGKSTAQVCLNWVINRPAVSSAIMGVSKVSQLEDNVGAVGWKLSAEHVKQLDEAFPV